MAQHRASCTSERAQQPTSPAAAPTAPCLGSPIPLPSPCSPTTQLDHGLIQEIPDNYAVALLEYIAHLSVGDWDSLADDLVALGFLEGIEGDREALVRRCAGWPWGRGLAGWLAGWGGGKKKAGAPQYVACLQQLAVVVHRISQGRSSN